MVHIQKHFTFASSLVQFHSNNVCTCTCAYVQLNQHQLFNVDSA